MSEKITSYTAKSITELVKARNLRRNDVVYVVCIIRKFPLTEKVIRGLDFKTQLEANLFKQALIKCDTKGVLNTHRIVVRPALTKTSWLQVHRWLTED